MYFLHHRTNYEHRDYSESDRKKLNNGEKIPKTEVDEFEDDDYDLVNKNDNE